MNSDYHEALRMWRIWVAHRAPHHGESAAELDKFLRRPRSKAEVRAIIDKLETIAVLQTGSLAFAHALLESYLSQVWSTIDRQARITLPPGACLNAVAEFLFSKKTSRCVPAGHRRFARRARRRPCGRPHGKSSHGLPSRLLRLLDGLRASASVFPEPTAAFLEGSRQLGEKGNAPAPVTPDGLAAVLLRKRLLRQFGIRNITKI
jgi:hypothetical protein